MEGKNKCRCTRTPGGRLSRLSGTESNTEFNRIMSQSHDGVYKRAMNLMSLRCHSNQFGPPSSAASLRYTRTPLIDTSTAPFGPSRRRFFYVDQRKPVPMAPLKAWRGYEGNVYFEPIKVYKVEREVVSQLYNSDTSNNRLLSIDRNASKTPTSGRSTVKGHRKMAILDRDYILSDNGIHTNDDIVWLVGQSSTGSLRMADSSTVAFDHSPDPGADRRICRGSVAHRLYELQRRGVSERQCRPISEDNANDSSREVKAGGAKVTDRNTLSVMSTSRTYKNRLLDGRHTNGVQTVR